MEAAGSRVSVLATVTGGTETGSPVGESAATAASVSEEA